MFCEVRFCSFVECYSPGLHYFFVFLKKFYFLLWCIQFSSVCDNSRRKLLRGVCVPDALFLCI
ncbi:hypothetical protein AS219_01360 [Neorickettsia sp. 179522]|nr:hypothetical protein AS219_01360 [Neorickettsia sp. 179522]